MALAPANLKDLSYTFFTHRSGELILLYLCKQVCINIFMNLKVSELYFVTIEYCMYSYLKFALLFVHGLIFFCATSN